MKLYISGPMRGHKHYNFPAFFAAECDLRNAGYEVVNPARMDEDGGFDPYALPDDHDWSQEPPGMRFEDVLQRDLAEIAKCDGMALLPGWEKSEGARREFYFAVQRNMPAMAVDAWLALALGIRDTEPPDVLTEAMEITSGPRRRDYDAPRPNHERIAALWNAYEGCKPSERRGTDGPEDVAAKMILLKLARHLHSPKRDNLVDIAGYARCMALIGGL